MNMFNYSITTYFIFSNKDYNSCCNPYLMYQICHKSQMLHVKYIKESLNQSLLTFIKIWDNFYDLLFFMYYVIFEFSNIRSFSHDFEWIFFFFFWLGFLVKFLSSEHLIFIQAYKLASKPKRKLGFSSHDH